MKAAKAPAHRSHKVQQIGRALFGGPPDSRLQTESQPALRFLRLTPDLAPQREAAGLHAGCAGHTLARDVVEGAHRADTSQIHVHLGRYEDRLTAHDRVVWISTSGAVKSA